MYKKHWRIQKTSVDGKNSAHPKSLAANVGAAGKVVGPADCLGSAKSATADFSHAPLMVSFSSLQMCWITYI